MQLKFYTDISFMGIIIFVVIDDIAGRFWSLFIPEVEFGCIRSDVLGIVLYISSSATFYLRNIMFANFLSS